MHLHVHVDLHVNVYLHLPLPIHVHVQSSLHVHLPVYFHLQFHVHLHYIHFQTFECELHNFTRPLLFPTPVELPIFRAILFSLARRRRGGRLWRRILGLTTSG